jgi:cytochrome d ubiquinol oxidase subunit I
MEGVFYTTNGAPLLVGGLADPATGKVYYALEIPHGLSFLLTGDVNSQVIGLDAFAAGDRPNAMLVHSSFDGMVGSGFFLLFVGIAFWLAYFLRKRQVPTYRWLLWGLVLGGPLAFLAIELGWMVTELGRQPWVIYGLLRTRDAVTTAPMLNLSFLAFSCIYVILAITLIWLLLRLARTPLPPAPALAAVPGKAAAERESADSELTNQEQATREPLDQEPLNQETTGVEGGATT